MKREATHNHPARSLRPLFGACAPVVSEANGNFVMLTCHQAHFEKPGITLLRKLMDERTIKSRVATTFGFALVSVLKMPLSLLTETTLRYIKKQTLKQAYFS